MQLLQLLPRAEVHAASGCGSLAAWGRASAEFPEWTEGRKLVNVFIIQGPNTGDVERRFKDRIVFLPPPTHFDGFIFLLALPRLPSEFLLRGHGYVYRLLWLCRRFPSKSLCSDFQTFTQGRFGSIALFLSGKWLSDLSATEFLG